MRTSPALIACSLFIALTGCKTAGSGSAVKDVVTSDAGGQVSRFLIVGDDINQMQVAAGGAGEAQPFVATDDKGNLSRKMCASKVDKVESCADGKPVASVPWKDIKDQLTVAWKLDANADTTKAIMSRVKSWFLPAKDPVADVWDETRFSDAKGKERFQQLASVLTTAFKIGQKDAVDDFFGEIAIGPAKADTPKEEPKKTAPTSPDSPSMDSLDFKLQAGDGMNSSFVGKTFSGAQASCVVVFALLNQDDKNPFGDHDICTLKINFKGVTGDHYRMDVLVDSTGNAPSYHQYYPGIWGCADDATMAMCQYQTDFLKSQGADYMRMFRLVQGRFYAGVYNGGVWLKQTASAAPTGPVPCSQPMPQFIEGGKCCADGYWHANEGDGSSTCPGGAATSNRCKGSGQYGVCSGSGSVAKPQFFEGGDCCSDGCWHANESNGSGACDSIGGGRGGSGGGGGGGRESCSTADMVFRGVYRSGQHFDFNGHRYDLEIAPDSNWNDNLTVDAQYSVVGYTSGATMYICDLR